MKFFVPQRGEKRRLLELAEKNGALLLDEERRNKKKDDQEYATALENLRKALGVEAYAPPHRVLRYFPHSGCLYRWFHDRFP